MNKYYCHDCGRYFETKDNTTTTCDLCGRDWLEKLIKCENCNNDFLAEKLKDGLCEDCIRQIKSKLLSIFTKKEIKIIYKYLENNEHLRS